MTNAFNWKGKPSIFTTGRRQSEFTEVIVAKNRATSLREKVSPIDLPGGSVYLPPKMDMLIKGGERGRRTKV